MKFHEQICGPQAGALYPALTATTSKSQIVGPGRMSQCAVVNVRVVFASDTSQGVVDVEACHDQNFTVVTVIGQLAWAVAGGTQAMSIPREWFGAFWRLKPSTAVNGAGAIAWATGQRN